MLFAICYSLTTKDWVYGGKSLLSPQTPHHLQNHVMMRLSTKLWLLALMRFFPTLHFWKMMTCLRAYLLVFEALYVTIAFNLSSSPTWTVLILTTSLLNPNRCFQTSMTLESEFFTTCQKLIQSAFTQIVWNQIQPKKCCVSVS